MLNIPKLPNNVIVELYIVNKLSPFEISVCKLVFPKYKELSIVTNN